MNLLSRFAALHHRRNLFRRQPLLESVARERFGTRPEEPLNRRLVGQARGDLDALLRQLGTSTQGLRESRARMLLQERGPNEIASR